MEIVVSGSRNLAAEFRLYRSTTIFRPTTPSGHTVWSILDQATKDERIEGQKVIVHGGASGVDACAHSWARANGCPVRIVKAEWDKYGKAAGPIRNVEMMGYADFFIAVWDGVSRGTKNAIQLARKQNIPGRIYIVQPSTIGANPLPDNLYTIITQEET